MTVEDSLNISTHGNQNFALLMVVFICTVGLVFCRAFALITGSWHLNFILRFFLLLEGRSWYRNIYNPCNDFLWQYHHDQNTARELPFLLMKKRLVLTESKLLLVSSIEPEVCL
ncbi:uncharacterized protein BT62DRAFT_558700 [Guyanagaster necrorhizus]|uniref:Uncharacterized protein n=1 Tax=Guyanagaster necrorhizus TaxID=856835 RepID=A0A9P7VI09_9AGAR|nr:uncharacterized protein BT62DRAFT_558700 [Guyanagaster necrorhizus MCA 3950]KAG7440948.1 hypothetical protein BT62DRAFT_558700 [Guyanagaster necrorhizus MCA 3950]